MKQLSTEFDKWMNYCEHTNTLWFEVLVTAILGQLNLSRTMLKVLILNILYDTYAYIIHSALQVLNVY